MMLEGFDDIHTHTAGLPRSILSIPTDRVAALQSHNASLPAIHRQHYSLQLHPWYADLEGQDFRNKAQALAHDPQLVAIGECGLDSLCETPIELQIDAFRTALLTARELHLPVIIHCVHLWSETIHLVHEIFPKLKTQPDQVPPVIIHGFRRGPQLAQQLLDAGFAISLGSKYNPEVAKMLPAERCYRETDQE